MPSVRLAGNEAGRSYFFDVSEYWCASEYYCVCVRRLSVRK